MFTALKIAWRFLINSKIQTLVIILGIAIGISVQIFVGLLSMGLETTLLDKVVGNSTHITIYPKNNIIENYHEKEAKIRKLDSKITSVAPVVEYGASIKRKDMVEAIQIRGFISKDLDSLYNIKNKIYKGRTILNPKEAILGKELSEKLGLKINDNIEVITPDGRNMVIKVVGFYDLDTIKVNKILVITDLKTAQDLAGVGDAASSMQLSTSDPYNADSIATKIETGLKDKNLKIENWKDQNKLLVSAIMGEKVCSIVIQLCVMIAAVLSIISIMGISVVQKYKQIGILKAMGIKDGSAGAIFLIQAFILGIVGTCLGVGLTYIYIRGFNRYIVSTDGTPIVKIIINYSFIIKLCIIDVIASTLAAFFPAIKSFKLTPVEVIKNG
ncbi:ABC transporter permease [Clostridium tagluense]|uniref:ABC transporter permease n=1 Tax=Clostridium tagluense TaxID=360422 RepID=UPI001CF2EFB0|nr:ABC transporter permease [Clostridium tagluense]MCB2312039.1 ABC transporter permease [Clostridium tagluense]MCB2316626.1 ABC transporter permease [Clostridium tagluense]MCB2321438.1 ABC transporter permease [Clostridium tagluense]MCB2326450.1 ABC transporter permease [Clostridium tagluense]MCB2331218.1 ABC transporter permease [Clostridium tagluense]